MSTNTLIEVKNIQVEYEGPKNKVIAIKSVNLKLNKGEIGVLIGPSGCGKSTLLHILAGVKQDYDGQVLYAGGSPQAAHQKTSLILQDYGLFPWKTVQENVAVGLKIRKLSKAKITEKVEQVLTQLGIIHLKERYPRELSGGQRQRVAIARSIALEPDLLLMDEPFSALDALTREELQDLVIKLWQQRQMSVLLVTHSIEEAAYLGQRIFVMSASPGQIIATVDNPRAGDATLRGKPEFYELCTRLRSHLKKEGAL